VAFENNQKVIHVLRILTRRSTTDCNAVCRLFSPVPTFADPRRAFER